MDEEKSKFSAFKKLFFTDEYLENKKDEDSEEVTLETETEPNIKKTIQNSIEVPFVIQNIEETNTILNKIYNYLDSINSPEIDFIEVWDAMDEMGGINEVNLKSTFTVMKIASKGKLSKDLIISTGNHYLSKINEQINIDLASKSNEIKILENKKQDESIFLEKKQKETEEQIDKLQSELAQTKNFIQDLNLKYDPKLKEIQQKIAAGQEANNKITNEIKNIISLVTKTL